MCGAGAGDSDWEEVTGGKIATREGLKKLMGIKDSFRYKTWENKPRNIQNLHRCQRDKSSLMASDMEAYAFWHLTQHRLGAYTRMGGGLARGPHHRNRASCLRAMQLFLVYVQYQLESNANYLRRAFRPRNYNNDDLN